ncbi:Asp-tRNA(Asn)/Glu-tRNA(Gln) amidotransferase subunit GatB [Segetibacter aerophilus]|uniref:Aspartyl/glutamyl-tRNA(Asn/Gln) amidotransferase subunit B n=1 Tax=Segetibacter aerophilus TaxID=670293 RepID=A0A512BJ26_9BACT|nr:Asp-tRNA(Asn)/Glu-tRNA(Gln) amidotransferase subunit GatB [Segetibacter aerophilus]GEO11964.1 aspartyl/glutamyl-tRNA(Asn/Gln) amidotransferase subunit B [Segetibacter aerophilus]
MDVNGKYEAVIGLEVHAQLQTQSKLFSGDSASFGAEPNTHISPITLAHPGTLPKTNKKAVEYAIMMGLACNCEIERYNYFARKNYFYPDLPKGYQVSQHTTPICKGGYVSIKTKDAERNVQLNRIHLEEDAGKSIHDADDNYTCIDLNRAGVPLIEIVTEPDMHSAEEAFQYVTEIRKLVRWIGVCDGNMEEGSLRCDANVSIRLKGETTLGTKVEVKNLNSIRNVKKAIEYEIDRMIGMVEKGETIIQQTRSFDADNDTTFAIRDKEEANDYRYFPEPDLTPFLLTEEFIAGIQARLPALPQVLFAKYKLLGLSEYDAHQMCDDKATAAYFEQAIAYSKNYKAIVNWMTGPLRQVVNEQNISFNELSITPKTLADLVTIVEEGKVNFSVASLKVLPVLLSNPVKGPLQVAEELNLIQVSGSADIENWVNEVLAKMPDKVVEYKKGKKGLIGLFVGEIKKVSKGKADPKKATQLLEEKLR